MHIHSTLFIITHMSWDSFGEEGTLCVLNLSFLSLTEYVGGDLLPRAEKNIKSIIRDTEWVTDEVLE